MQRTSTGRASKFCPSSEDFVSCNGLRPRRASRSAPRRRTLSRKNGLRPNEQGQNNKTGRADEDNADGANRWIKQARRNKPCSNYLADGGRFLRWTLGRCYGGLCVSAVVERLDENVVSKDNDRLGGEIFRFTVEPRGRRYDSASPRGSYLFNRFKSQNRAAMVNSLLLSCRDVLSTNMPMQHVRGKKMTPSCT